VYMLTADKANDRFCIDMKCHAKHYVLLEVKSISQHKLFFRTDIYQHESTVKTVILQATVHM
jgi:hypothetical protein